MAGKKNQQAVEVSCGESLDISTTAELYGTLMAALTDGTSVVLQADKVARADAAALQALAFFMREAGSRNVPVAWQQPSETLCRAANLLGLAQGLALPASA